MNLVNKQLIMKNIFALIFIFSLLCLQSCLKEEEDIFGQSSAERLIEAQKEYEKILASAENGWTMDYYTGLEGNRIGGYQIICKFEGGKATMAGAFTLKDYKTVGEKIESSYTINRMQGPCLSFNTYNTVLHQFADPNGVSDPYGFAGDFEFVIVKATKEEIILRGVKYKHTIVMRPMEPAKDWDEYCQEVVKLKEEISQYTRFEVNKSGQTAGYVTIWGTDSQMHDTDREDIYVENYTVDNKGIRLYSPLTIGGNTINELTWDKDNAKFIDSNQNTGVELAPISIKFEQLLGTYEVTGHNFDEPIEVTLTDAGDGKNIRVSSNFLRTINEDLDYEFTIEVYDNNRLGIKTQSLGKKPGSNTFYTLAVCVSTNLILGTTNGYNASYPYSGSWYRFSAEKPELRFLSSTFTSLIFTSTILGVRVLETRKENSVASGDIVGTRSAVINSPIFTKK